MAKTSPLAGFAALSGRASLRPRFQRPSSRRRSWLKEGGKARVEALEGRVLLAVTAGEYDTIRSSYPGFNLPTDMASINIIEITPDQLSVADLKSAITTAGSTTLPDLVVLRTTDTQNTITYASSADAVTIDIPSAQGAISIVGFGSKPLTIDAANQCGVISVGSYLSTTTVNLGGVTLTGGYVSSGQGGGVYQAYGTLNLTNVTVSGNTAPYGGGVFLYYGTSTLTNVTISGNGASYGGGVYQYRGTATVVNVTISGNMVSVAGIDGGGAQGGGVFFDYGTSTLMNVIISGNTATTGGGLYQYNGTSTLVNATICGNTTYNGGGVGVYLRAGTFTLRNTVVAHNTASSGPDVVRYTGGGAILNGSNNMIGDGSGQTSLVNGSNGNLVGTSASPIDPQFVNIFGSDWRYWDLRLQATSLGVDAGNNAWIPSGVTTDIGGGARVINGTVDMGAYEFDRAPTSLLLSSSTIGENQPVGMAVGTLSTIDPDIGDSFTYSLIGGTGSTDNGSFTISGNQLLTAASFNYETKNSYLIHVQTTDSAGWYYEKVFTINVSDVNEAPTDISLSSTSVNEGQLPGTVVAAIMTSDPDISDTFTYALVSGAGADDNASFTIEGSELKTTAIFSAAAKSSYVIRMRSTDAGGLWVERAFEITVITSGVPAVVWSSYLGGSGNDYGYSTALDGSGNAWVTGYTDSAGWMTGGYDTSYDGAMDGFVAKLNTDGTLAWCTYLGGSGADNGRSIAIDASGNAWVTGTTFSAGWTSGGFDTSHNGGNDVFVAKINADGTLAWSSHLGGSDDDRGEAIALDTSGNAWVTGYTYSPGWASGGFDSSHNGGFDAFVAKINADGTLAWSSYLGGSSHDYGRGIAVDASGNGWVTGYTSSPGWTSGGFDTTYDGTADAFLAKINANGTLAWSSYVGGSYGDYGFGIAVDASGNAWVTGETSSPGWTSGGVDTTYNGTTDAFLAKINANGTLAWSSYLGGSNIDWGNSIALDAGGNAWVTGGTYSAGWTNGGFDTSLNGVSDGFLAKINASGTLAWSSYLDGAGYGNGVGLDTSGNAWVAGYTESSGWTSGGFDTTYNGDGDGFVAKVSLNHAPTALGLSSGTIGENQPAGTVVGSFSTSDLDAGDRFTYSLVSGAGSTDNGAFQVVGDKLQSAAVFDFETKSSYSIRVRATDQGGLVYEKTFTITVTDVDEVAPTVTAVYVKGSSWASGYLSFLAANLAGSSATYGYAIPAGSGAAQLQTLPWRNVNQISVGFSKDVSVAQAQFAIVGSVGSYSVSGFSYSAADHVATWSLSAAIGPDKLYVVVPGSGGSPITDPAGNVLDGEWVNPSSYSDASSTDTFPSGNGVAGGDFAFRLDVLPGDSSGGSLGKVNVADVAQTKTRSNLSVSTSTYRSDFDGNNLVNVADVAYVKSKSSVYSLPVNLPVLPVFGPVFSQVNLLQGNRLLTLL